MSDAVDKNHAAANSGKAVFKVADLAYAFDNAAEFLENEEWAEDDGGAQIAANREAGRALQYVRQCFMIVCMNTVEKTNNDRLRELVTGAKLSQSAALTLFNRGFGIRGIKESTWKGYFCDPSTTRYRRLNDELMEHAEKIFRPLQK